MVLNNCGNESKLKATGVSIHVPRGAGLVYPWAPRSVPASAPACKAQSRMFLPDMKEMLWPRLQLSRGCQWKRQQVPMGQQNALPEIPLKAGLAIWLLLLPLISYRASLTKGWVVLCMIFFLALFSFKNIVNGYGCHLGH